MKTHLELCTQSSACGVPNCLRLRERDHDAATTPPALHFGGVATPDMCWAFAVSVAKRVGLEDAPSLDMVDDALTPLYQAVQLIDRCLAHVAATEGMAMALRTIPITYVFRHRDEVYLRCMERDVRIFYTYIPGGGPASNDSGAGAKRTTSPRRMSVGDTGDPSR